MVPIRAVNNRILDVDLTAGCISVIDVSESDRRAYLGGKGLAIKLLHDHVAPGTDPLDQGNVLIIMTGPAAGTASPTGGRFVVAGKSPLTGIFASSVVGGTFGVKLKRAGFDGILVRGRAASPVYLMIEDGEAAIKDASALWGMDTVDLQEARKDEGDWVVIGPAGENRVRFALIAAGSRVAGRCGLGAVMGSKNLKGIVARGSRKVVPADPSRFKKAVDIARRKVDAHENTGKNLRELGTPQNVMIYGTRSIMPVRNFSRSKFKAIGEINAEKIRDDHFVKRHGCIGCPIQCGRTGTFRGKKRLSPEYETIALMGPNLMISDLDEIAGWNEKLNRLGMDSISTGNVLGFAMELTEKGMLASGLSFGSTGGIDEVLDDIAYRRGLGDDLAEGVKRFSEKYGGADFAIHVKGLEMAGYDPRGCTGQGLGYATANSGATHLSGSTHAVEAESYLSPHGTKGKAHFVRFMQDLTDAVNSAIFCIQTEYCFLEENFLYQHTPMTLLRLLMRNLPSVAVATTDLSDYGGLLSGILGYEVKPKTFYEIGERIFNLERTMNCREGIGRADDTLPHRILEEVGEEGWAPVELEKMLEKYYWLRGWDESGRPLPKTLERLGIQG